MILTRVPKPHRGGGGNSLGRMMMGDLDDHGRLGLTVHHIQKLTQNELRRQIKP